MWGKILVHFYFSTILLILKGNISYLAFNRKKDKLEREGKESLQKLTVLKALCSFRNLDWFCDIILSPAGREENGGDNVAGSASIDKGLYAVLTLLFQSDLGYV